MLTLHAQFSFKVALAIGALAFTGGLAFGDTVLENGGPPTFTNMPANLTPNNGTPYWNNNSGDGSQKNIGYFLTGTGGFNGSMDYNPLAYLSQSGTPDAPVSFDLLRDTNSLLITLIGINTTDPTDVFGYYDGSKTTVSAAQATEQPLFSTATAVNGSTTVNLSAALAGSGITQYGFYMTKCANAACSQSYTFFSNSALDIASTDTAGHQHFALFNFAADANVLYLGSEDWFGDIEGYGDYNDMVFKINSDAIPVATPEPATFALLAAGLFAIGMAKRFYRPSAPAGRSIT